MYSIDQDETARSTGEAQKKCENLWPSEEGGKVGPEEEGQWVLEDDRVRVRVRVTFRVRVMVRVRVRYR